MLSHFTRLRIRRVEREVNGSFDIRGDFTFGFIKHCDVRQFVFSVTAPLAKVCFTRP